MRKLNRPTLALLAVIATSAVPSTASATQILPDVAPPSNPVAAVPFSVPAPSPGFQWDDAALGAGAALLVVAAGSGASVARRRQAAR